MASPTTHHHAQAKSLAMPQPTSDSFNPGIAGIALAKGLLYLKSRLGWSGTKIARLLHLPANTLNLWLKQGCVPLHSEVLSPDIQAIIHLLAIHRSLEAMFDDPTHQIAWLMTHHPDINTIPHAMMSESFDGLIFIRQYLDYARGKGA